MAAGAPQQTLHLGVQSSRSISTSAFSSRRMMKLRQKIFGGFGSDRAGVDPAERVAAGDLGRRGTIRPQSTPAAFPTRRSEPPAGGGVAADHERDTVSKTFQSLS